MIDFEDIQFFPECVFQFLLPQGTERDAGTGSGAEKRGTFFCGGKASTGERTDSIKTDCRELTESGRLPVFFVLCYPVGNNTVY